jgi:hypothetical protein
MNPNDFARKERRKTKNEESKRSSGEDVRMRDCKMARGIDRKDLRLITACPSLRHGTGHKTGADFFE